ncbi:hypothetical protein V8C86DRAFT_2625605 [Haematococcus lacustris]
MAGWLRGTVKEVVSGDTVVICGAVKSGPPPEKRLTLSSVIAPKLAKRDGSTKDEPFAWASREFLRQKIIGQQVVFKTDYVVEQIGNREFGSIFLEKENVACSLVAAGLAKVRASGTQQSPYIESLRKAEEHAQLAGLGLWTKDADALANSVRSVPFDGSFSASAFLQAAGGKGTVITGIVEAVANGGMLRITTLPDYQQAIVVLCGVQAPSMGRKVAPATASESEATPSPAMPSAASIAGSSNAEPFAREAKQLTEARALNREVRLVLEGVDKYENLFATVYVPPMPTPAGTANGASAGPEGNHVNGSNGAAHSQDSLAELLVKVGYAKCVEWSLGLMTSGSNRLRDLEKAAKAERRGMWTNWVPPVTNQNKLSDTFHGKVVEVVSGDCLVIKDMTSGVERRVQLSSLRAPRMGTRERGPDPWATDAKEFLRKKLIGREVDVKMEYTRKVPITGPDAGPGNEERLLSFGNVELAADSKGGEEAQNVAEMVVARGFANVIKHRMDEERSSVYEKLVECEELAKNAKRGVFSTKEPAANRMNDVSAPGNAQKAKQYLSFLQRGGRMQGIVEFVLSGHRLKVTIPKEGVTIVFAPSGIKTPSRAQPAQHGKPAVQGEPFADEAVSFTRELALQHDCEVMVETMDRGGTFLGSISILPTHPQAKPVSLALALLRAGLARLQPNVDPFRLPDGAEMVALQKAARDARLKIWQNWTPEMERAETGEDEEDSALGTNGNGAAGHRQLEVMDVAVTEVVDASEFYVQRVHEPRVQWVAEQMQAVAAAPPPPIPPELRVGQLCCAQFSLDKQWYRAYVEKTMPLSSQYQVYFIDFGNKEVVSDKCVRLMEPALAAVPPQALQCCLAYLKVPSAGVEYANEARALLTQLLGGGQPLTATVISKEKPGAKDNAKNPRWANNKLAVTLVEPNSQGDVAVELLCAGLARLPKLTRVKDPLAKQAIQDLSPYEEEAREARRGLYTYGDPGDSEDEEKPAPKAAAWGKPR